MNKHTKIELFLIIGFLVSTFAFSLTISVVYSKYNKVVEKNQFNKDYKYLKIDIVHEAKYVDGAEIVNKDEDEENPSLSEIVDAVQNAGHKKIILSPFTEQIQVDNKFYINDIWPCSNGISIESENLIKGRYLDEEELMSNEKVAIIGFGLERLVEEKNGENYIKIFDEYYKVIGVIGNTEVFKYSSIIPIKSLYFIDNKVPTVTFYENSIDNINAKEINMKNTNIVEREIPKVSVIDYLFKNVYELKNSLCQIVLGIINLLLFSYFFAKNIRKKIAIMKVLGAKNFDVFKEVFTKFIRISSIGIVAGLALSKITIDFMIKSFVSQYSAINIINIALSSLLIFIISIIVSIVVLFDVIRFKIMKEIR